MLEIVLLAMVAAFLGLRLYSVLGRRAEQEEEPVPQRFGLPTLLRSSTLVLLLIAGTTGTLQYQLQQLYQ